MRVTAYTPDGTCVMLQWNRHDASTHIVYDSRWHGQLMSWLASLTLEDEVRQDMSLPRLVCEYEDVFPDELPGLPPPRDVDFRIELHPGTSSRSRYRSYWARVSLDQALHHGVLRFYLRRRRIRPFDYASITDS